MNDSDFKKHVSEAFELGGITLAPEQIESMDAYYNCLVRENAKYNLTAITAPEEAAAKHFFDSAAAAVELPQGAKVLDVGSGGGFPIVPLKILRPDIQAYAMDATAKKCRFIELASAEAGIAVNVINARAEEAKRLREKYEVCVSRAVADLPVLLELCAAFVVRGGYVICYKSDAAEEIVRAGNAANLLGLKLEKTLDYDYRGMVRQIPVYKKVDATPAKYPRMFSQIRKNPL